MTAPTPIAALVRLGLSYYPALIAFWMVCTWTALRLAERGVDAALIGVFSALPWVAVLFVSPFVARLRAALGWRGLYQLGNVLALASVAGFATTSSFAAWCAWAVLSGVALTVRWIVADAWAAAITPAHSQGRMVGAFETLAGTAIAIGPAFVAATGLAGARAPLVMAGLLAISWFVGRSLAEPEAKFAAAPARPLGRWWGSAGILVVVLSGGLLESGFGSMLPVYGVARELTAAQSSLLLTAANASALFLQWPVGWLSDRFGPARILQATALLGVLAAAAVLVASGLPALFGAVFLWGGIVGTFYTLGRILAARQRPDEVVAVMSSVAMLYTLGAIIGPPVAGAALSAGGTGGFGSALVGAAILLAAAVALTTRRRP